MTTHNARKLAGYALVLTLGVVLVMTAAVLASQGSTPSAYASTPAPSAPAPAPAPMPIPGQAIYLTDQDCALIGLASNHVGQCLVDADGERYDLVAIAAPQDEEPAHPGVDLLLEAGYTGEAVDALVAIYAPAGLALYDEHGYWMVTTYGLTRCEHSSAALPCTGFELAT